jgi:hypothetical protein
MSHGSVLAAICAALALAPAGLAHAQSPAVVSARTSLSHYDLTGSGTLDALTALGPVAASGGADALEARYLRAVAGTDLAAIAIATHDDALGARLATALGVPTERLAAELRTELGAVASGLYRSVVAEERALLDAAERAAAGELPASRSAPRLAALSLLVLAHAPEARLAGLASAPDAQAPAGLDEGTRRAVAGLREAFAAYDRASRAARDGDPLLAALAPRLDAARAGLASTTLAAQATVPADWASPHASAAAASGPTPAVVVLVADGRVAIACVPSVRMSDGTHVEAVMPSAHCPEVGTARAFTLPATLPPVPQPIDALSAALGELGLGAAHPIAIAPAATAPAHLVSRVLRSLAHAHLAASSLAARGPDGALATFPIGAAAPDAAPATSVHLRLGGYAISRAHGHDADLPRLHDASGFRFDHDGLAHAITGQTAVGLDAMGTVAAGELVHATRILASAGARVILAGQ